MKTRRLKKMTPALGARARAAEYARRRPERPPCALCGTPAHNQLTLEVCDLALGTVTSSGRPYWRGDYPASMRVEMNLCTECVTKRVNVGVNVEADVKANRT